MSEKRNLIEKFLCYNNLYLTEEQGENLEILLKVRNACPHDEVKKAIVNQISKVLSRNTDINYLCALLEDYCWKLIAKRIREVLSEMNKLEELIILLEKYPKSKSIIIDRISKILSKINNFNKLYKAWLILGENKNVCKKHFKRLLSNINDIKKLYKISKKCSLAPEIMDLVKKRANRILRRIESFDQLYELWRLCYPNIDFIRLIEKRMHKVLSKINNLSELYDELEKVVIYSEPANLIEKQISILLAKIKTLEEISETWHKLDKRKFDFDSTKIRITEIVEKRTKRILSKTKNPDELNEAYRSSDSLRRTREFHVLVEQHINKMLSRIDDFFILLKWQKALRGVFFSREDYEQHVPNLLAKVNDFYKLDEAWQEGPGDLRVVELLEKRMAEVIPEINDYRSLTKMSLRFSNQSLLKSIEAQKVSLLSKIKHFDELGKMLRGYPYYWKQGTIAKYKKPIETRMMELPFPEMNIEQLNNLYHKASTPEFKRRIKDERNKLLPKILEKLKENNDSSAPDFIEKIIPLYQLTEEGKIRETFEKEIVKAFENFLEDYPCWRVASSLITWWEKMRPLQKTIEIFFENIIKERSLWQLYSLLRESTYNTPLQDILIREIATKLRPKRSLPKEFEDYLEADLDIGYTIPSLLKDVLLAKCFELRHQK